MSRRRPPLYPLFCDLAGRCGVVVGGGRVAARKAADLLRAGARVRVVSPAFGPELRGMDGLERVEQPYEARCLAGAVLVIAATDDPAVNAQVARDARARGLWVNVVDQPQLCDFHVPAVMRRGPIQIAVSTGGASPALARQVRLAIEPVIDDAYGHLAQLIGELRPIVRRTVPDRATRRAILEEFASERWLQHLRREGREATRRAMRQALEARRVEGGTAEGL